MRKIQFPDPVSYSQPGKEGPGPWGLADFLVERCLSLPDYFTTVEQCNRIFSLTTKISPLRGLAQRGRSVSVTDEELEFLKQAFANGLQTFSRQAGGVLPAHLLSDFALYAKALFSADVIPDVDPVEKQSSKNASEAPS